MRIAAFTKYSRLGASSRLRTLQYIPRLEEFGIEVCPQPLFDDSYLMRFNSGSPSRLDIPRYFFRRLSTLRHQENFDGLWVEKELFPWMPWLLERQAMPHNLPIIVDYDDAIFHNYDRHRSAVVRSLLASKIDQVMARADIVIAGNEYLRGRAEVAGARRVELIPTVVDADRYRETDYDATARSVRIGWIGSPSTTRYLNLLGPVTTALKRSHEVTFVAIGARHDQCPTDFLALPWSEGEEVDQIRSFTIGIMPLLDGDWERGKCGYKLIQYMACGIPVVASPVGANVEIVREGVDGFLASTETEWQHALERLLSDPELRRRMGQAGRARVAERYSLEGQIPRLANILHSIV